MHRQKLSSVNLLELRHKSLDNLSVQVIVAAAPESFRLSGQHCINMAINKPERDWQKGFKSRAL